MIKGLTTGQTGGYLYTSGSSGTPYISANHNNPMAGVLRLNGSNLETFDGSGWMPVGGYADISLSGTAIAALDWANKKMSEETKIQDLAKTNPTIADAYNTYLDAQEKLKVVLTLTETDDQVTPVR